MTNDDAVIAQYENGRRRFEGQKRLESSLSFGARPRIPQPREIPIPGSFFGVISSSLNFRARMSNAEIGAPLSCDFLSSFGFRHSSFPQCAAFVITQ
jgi:hypothetical protein